MVTINKIYTKTGDAGQTHLVGGTLVEKDTLRIQAIGDIDELNAVLGLVATAINEPELSALQETIYTLQQRLFDLGAEVASATPESSPIKTGAEDVTQLEQSIDTISASLAPLTSFVLPGGHPVCATLHLARAVCRRAERSVVALQKQETLSQYVLPYMNRLSDFLFALSRHAAQSTGTDEILWDSRRKAAST